MSSENRPMFDIQAAVYSDRLHYGDGSTDTVASLQLRHAECAFVGTASFLYSFFQCNLFKGALKHFSN